MMEARAWPDAVCGGTVPPPGGLSQAPATGKGRTGARATDVRGAGRRAESIQDYPDGLLTNVQSDSATVTRLGMGPNISGVGPCVANSFEPRAL
jgi:hypothetical protein